MIGSSHVTHWKRYRWSVKLPEDDRQILSKFFFMGVGGAKLIDLLDLLEAKNLPPHKKDLKDQWQNLKEKNFKADYVIVAIGSNDCDDVDHVSKARAYMCEKDTQFKKDTLAEFRK